MTRPTLLALSLVLCTAPALAQSASELNEQFNAAYEKKDWDAAARLGTSLAEIRPQEPGLAYNLACVLALKGDGDEAVRWLLEAAKRGFADRGLAESDADLQSIRSRSGYRIALERIGENEARALTEFKAMARDSAPLIIMPPGFDATKPAPVIVAMHPYGGTVERFAEIWKPLAAEVGAILALPRAMRQARDGYQWGPVGEAEWLVTRTLDAVSAKHAVDERNVVVTGFSQGGFMAFNLGIKLRERITGIIPVGGQYARNLAAPPTTGGGPRVYIMVGAEDRVEGSNRLAYRDFRAAGLSTELVVYPGLGHAFPKDRDVELRKALKYVMR